MAGDMEDYDETGNEESDYNDELPADDQYAEDEYNDAEQNQNGS